MAKSIDLGNSATALKSSAFEVPSTFARTDWQHWASPAHPQYPSKADPSENSECWRIHGDEAGLKSNHRSGSGGSTAARHTQSQGRSHCVHWISGIHGQERSWPHCRAPQSHSRAQTRAQGPSLSLNRIPGLVSRAVGGGEADQDNEELLVQSGSLHLSRSSSHGL